MTEIGNNIELATLEPQEVAQQSSQQEDRTERAAIYASMLIVEQPSGHQGLVSKVGLE